MILGVIDIGSHSCRLKIERREIGKAFILKEDMRTTGLIQGVLETGFLSNAAMEETLSALRSFQEALREAKVDLVRAVATAAMREAQNAWEFVKRIEQETGLQVEIISGEEEAALSYLGMRAHLPRITRPLLVDVGGGSSEFYCPGLVQMSLKMGVVRASRETSMPMWSHECLRPLFPLRQELHQCTLVGCGGTITSLAAIFHHMRVYNRDKIQGCILSRAKIRNIFYRLSNLSLEERTQVAGLQPQRAEVIVNGIAWVLQIMDFLAVKQLIVSDADLRDGILMQLEQVLFARQSQMA